MADVHQQICLFQQAGIVRNTQQCQIWEKKLTAGGESQGIQFQFQEINSETYILRCLFPFVQ